MESIRRQRGTCGSNKKRFAGGDSDKDYGVAEMRGFNRGLGLRFSRPEVSTPWKEAGLPPSREMVNARKMMERGRVWVDFQNRIRESIEDIERRRAERAAADGPDNEHPRRAGHDLRTRMLRLRLKTGYSQAREEDQITPLGGFPEHTPIGINSISPQNRSQ